MESKQNDLAEELARLAIATAIENLTVTDLMWISKGDDEMGKLDHEVRVMTSLLTKKILDKIPDLAGWIVQMAQDELEPTTDSLSLYANEKPVVRIHFAFEKGFPVEDRQGFMIELGKIINENV